MYAHAGDLFVEHHHTKASLEDDVDAREKQVVPAWNRVICYLLVSGGDDSPLGIRVRLRYSGRTRL